ncbi:site-specific integrase [Kiritimatiellota bacterium B12222]|nr:site-specific integrase [Kiritimatiellota bacterium B12222]
MSDPTQQWELTPEKFLNEHELAQMLTKAEELYILGERRKSKAMIRDAFLIQTALLTGLRNSEICNLKVIDLRIGNGQSHLIVRNGKGSKQRTVHIGKEYKRILKRYLQWKMDQEVLHPEAYLLRSERAEKYSPSALWRRWKKYCPKTLHCARHTNATLMFQSSGSNLRMVQKQLGHSRITTTQIYADVMPQVMQENMSSMEKLAKSLQKKGGQSSIQALQNGQIA